MGRKAMHTQEQVFNAADQLVAAGQEVTPSTLRAALGGGSLTTIYKHLEAWQGMHKEIPKVAAIAMPEVVERSFMAAWQAASAEAGKEIAAIKEKTDAEVKAATLRFDEALANISQLETEAEADAIKIEALESQLATSQAELIRVNTDAATQDAKWSATCGQLEQQLGGQQTELHDLRKENKELIAQHAKLQGQLEAMQNQIKEQNTLLGNLVPNKK
jgi:DNA repair exonuclease SbcCD ATPase subunit